MGEPQVHGNVGETKWVRVVVETKWVSRKCAAMSWRRNDDYRKCAAMSVRQRVNRKCAAMSVGQMGGPQMRGDVSETKGGSHRDKIGYRKGAQRCGGVEVTRWVSHKCAAMSVRTNGGTANVW